MTFDLDGTLANTSADLIAAANATFGLIGLGDILDAQADQAIALTSVDAILRLGFERANTGFGEDQVRIYHSVLLKTYADNIDTHTYLYPGVGDAVEALSSAGYRLGICTNKPEALAQKLLHRLGVRSKFEPLIGGDTLATRKPDPAPLLEAVPRACGNTQKTVLIGDAVTDLNTARAAAAKIVLVTSGPGGRNVGQLKPDAVLDHYRDLTA
ncbi:MAG: HAD-IA family hydrolase [Paracoccaceae bacterium]